MSNSIHDKLNRGKWTLSGFLNYVERSGWLILTLIGVCGIIFSTIANQANNGVLMRGDHYDAGIIKEGDSVHNTLRLYNLTLRPIKFFAVASCGCTALTTRGNVIAPLRMATVDISVNTHNMPEGPMHKDILLYFAQYTNAWEKNVHMNFRVSRTMRNQKI